MYFDNSTLLVVKSQLIFFLFKQKKMINVKKMSRKTGFYEEIIEKVFEKFPEGIEIIIDKKNIKYYKI